jgi:putative effector of murein hydrolase
MLSGGTVTFKGAGSLYDDRYSKYAQSQTLVFNGIDVNTIQYTITLYPTSGTLRYYFTDIPVYASVASVMIIMLTALSFFLYDYFMKRDNQDKIDTLNSKRR